MMEAQCNKKLFRFFLPQEAGALGNNIEKEPQKSCPKLKKKKKKNTVHHVPKCMSCHKAIVVITGRAHSFHDYIYIYIYIYYAHLASVRFEHSVCRGSLMTIYIYIKREYLLCLQSNAKGSFLQKCINSVEQRLKFSHCEGSIIP